MDELYARNAIAREVIYQAINSGLNRVVSWEDFPEIGEHDWNHIVAETLLIAINFRPPLATVENALKVLAERATED